MFRLIHQLSYFKPVMNKHLDILKNITTSIDTDLELYQKEFDQWLDQ